MLTIDHINDLATTLRGNYQKFDCFAWSRECDLPDPDNWLIQYTCNRDSGLLEQSNARVIANILAAHFEGEDISVESHGHWACGWVEGYAIRVHRLDWNGVDQEKDAKYTSAFLAWYEIENRLSSYPILDEDDYSSREYNACLDNIETEGRDLIKSEFNCQDWASEVYQWLSDNDSSEIENRDDQGAYPSEEAIALALHDLGKLDDEYLHLVADCE